VSYTPRLSHTSLFNRPTEVWRSVQTTKRPHYVILSSLLSPPSWLSAPCPQMPSTYLECINFSLCTKVLATKAIPGQALGAPEGWHSQNSYTVGTWRWQGCQSFFIHGRSLALVFVTGWVKPSATVLSEGWTIPMAPSGREPATFRLVVQCLNEIRHRV
jgi:hypothetical protein